MAFKTSNAQAAGLGARGNVQDGCLNSTEIQRTASSPQELPSRAVLARRWPGLRVNRLTWRWRAAAAGAKGDMIDSLLAFLGEGGR